MIAHRYLPLAREELNEAASFYEARVPGLGAAFLDDVDRSIEMMCGDPRIGAAAGRTFRKLLVRRFPYSIIYALRDEELSSSRSLISGSVRGTGGGDNDC